MYVLLDTSLLADVFQVFRKTILLRYGLDPCHFYSAPGLAWAAALKFTKIKLELITDIDQYQFIESGIRGGISQVSKRMCVANNKYLNNFDTTKESKYITYVDSNNLYALAMDQYLPYSEFKWLNKDEIKSIKWLTVPDNNDIGYFLEVDLIYPKHLHDLHKDYPLAPEHRKVCDDYLSDYQKITLNLMKKHNYKRVATKKLILTLYDKNNYVLHYRNLKLYLRLGLKLKKIHRVISFKQTNWLSPYIQYNTELRKKAVTDFEKNLIKLLNNAVFGKSIENKRNRVNVKLAVTEKEANRLLKKPNFDEFYIINNNKTLIRMKQQLVILDKPIYLGFTVLELSKYHMYRMHYDCFKKHYGKNIELAYTDTDSFIYEIKTKDLYSDFKNFFSNVMDLSDYPKNHYLQNDLNKKVLGAMKDEMNSKVISEFIGLKSKLYSLKYGDNEFKSTGKGLQKTVLKKFVHHNHYKNVLLYNNLYSFKMRKIQSKLHEIETIELNKLIFTPIDDKRYILEDGITSIPFGYTNIL